MIYATTMIGKTHKANHNIPKTTLIWMLSGTVKTKWASSSIVIWL